MNPSAEQADSCGWRMFWRPVTCRGHVQPGGSVSAAVPCEVRCMAQSGWQDDPTATAWVAQQQPGRRGCFRETPKEGRAPPGRAAWRAEACSCLSGARQAAAASRRRGMPALSAASRGDDSRPQASRKLQREEPGGGRKQSGAPGGRPGGGALPGTCPRDDSGKRRPGQEERE